MIGCLMKRNYSILRQGVQYQDGSHVTIQRRIIPGQLARRIREGEAIQIKLFIE